LIGHQIQSFEARKKTLWISAPYIFIIVCVKWELGSDTLKWIFYRGDGFHQITMVDPPENVDTDLPCKSNIWNEKRIAVKPSFQSLF
jgi:hypothetical protein